MRKGLVISILLVLVVSITGCTKTVVNKDKPKPTKSGAKAAAVTYFMLRESGKYAEAYKILSPSTRKLVSKTNFSTNNKDTPADYYAQLPADYYAHIPKPDVFEKVVDVHLDGNKAIVTANAYMYGNERRTFVFTDGKWYRDFEATRLLEYGVKPESITSIKHASLHKTFSTPAFKAVVTKVEKNKIFTGETQFNTPADGIYVIAHLTITNTGRQTLRFPSFPLRTYLLLIDSRQRQFRPSQPNTFSAVDYTILIDPGKSQTYTAGFDVPESAKGFRLIVGAGKDAVDDVVYRVDLGV